MNTGDTIFIVLGWKMFPQQDEKSLRCVLSDVNFDLLSISSSYKIGLPS